MSLSFWVGKKVCRNCLIFFSRVTLFATLTTVLVCWNYLESKEKWKCCKLIVLECIIFYTFSGVSTNIDVYVNPIWPVFFLSPLQLNLFSNQLEAISCVLSHCSIYCLARSNSVTLTTSCHIMFGTKYIVHINTRTFFLSGYLSFFFLFMWCS